MKLVEVSFEPCGFGIKTFYNNLRLHKYYYFWFVKLHFVEK